jgi:hypothetical protein
LSSDVVELWIIPGYPQVWHSFVAGLPVTPHAGLMTQTLTAGDDFPGDRHDQPPSLVIRAGSPAALLRIVPHLIGFVP